MTNGVIFPCDDAEDVFNTDPVRLWNNDGTGVMTEVSDAVQFTDTRSGKGYVVFDYDNDGDLDVFIANNGDTPILFRNNGGNDNDWLRVNVIGETTNRMGLGARVKVRLNPGDPFQLREINANSNYMSQNETTAHFGLGPSAASIDLVRVEWPATGFIQEFRNVSPNTTPDRSGRKQHRPRRCRRCCRCSRSQRMRDAVLRQAPSPSAAASRTSTPTVPLTAPTGRSFNHSGPNQARRPKTSSAMVPSPLHPSGA